MKRTLLTLLIIFLAACGPIAEIPLPTATPDDAQRARLALTGFFDALNRGDYRAADGLFWDDYEILGQMNPDTPTSKHEVLWEFGCRYNGFQCLKVKEVVSYEQADANTFRFVVRFQNADGTLFVQGPCCGENPAGAPAVSEFKIQVRRDEKGTFRVMDMPPYVP